MARAIDAIKKDRVEKLEKLKKLKVNPYPSKIELSGELVKIAKARESLGKKVLTAGRIWSLRKHGGVIFADLKDDSEKIQLLFQEKELGKDFEVLDLIDTADFLAAIGEVIKTPAGEVTIDVSM